MRTKDASLIVSAPLHTTLANSPGIDLGQVQGGLIDNVQLEIISPLSPATTATICTYTLQDSADGTTYTTIDPNCSTSITAASSSLAAKTTEFRLPPVTRRFVRVQQTGNTLGAVSGSFIVSVLL